jgi:hypothetical protein
MALETVSPFAKLAADLEQRIEAPDSGTPTPALRESSTMSPFAMLAARVGQPRPALEQGQRISPFGMLASRLDARIAEQADPDPLPESEDTLLDRGFKGFRRGLLETRALGHAAGAMGGLLFGGETYAADRLADYDRLSQEAFEVGAGITFADVRDDPARFVAWAAQETGAGIPYIVSSLVGGGFGGVIGRMVASGAIKRAAGEALAENIRRKAISRGFQSGLFASVTGLESGAILGEQHENDLELRPEVALGFGAGSGAINMIPWLSFAGLAGVGPIAQRYFIDKIRGLGFFKRVGVTAAGGLGIEATTEALQEVNAMVARSFVDDNFDILGPEAKDRVIEAAATGGLLGTVFGGIGGVFARPPPGLDTNNPDDVAEFLEAQRISGRRPGDDTPPDGGPGGPGGPVDPIVPPPHGPIMENEDVHPGIQGDGLNIPRPLPLQAEDLADTFTPAPRETAAPLTGEVIPAPAPATATQALVPGVTVPGEVVPGAVGGGVPGLVGNIVGSVPGITGPVVTRLEERLTTLANGVNRAQPEIPPTDVAIAAAEMIRTEENVNNPLDDFTIDELAARFVDELQGEGLLPVGFSATAEARRRFAEEPAPPAALRTVTLDVHGLPTGPEAYRGGVERLRRAGAYVDEREAAAIARGSPRTPFFSKMSFDLPGLPPVSSPDYADVSWMDLDQAIRNLMPGLTVPAIVHYNSLTRAVSLIRQGIAAGVLEGSTWGKLQQVLSANQLSVTPAPLTTPYLKRIEGKTDMTVTQIKENWAEADSDELSVLSLVMEKLGFTDLSSMLPEDASVDMDMFRQEWGRHMPSLRLIRGDRSHIVPEILYLGLGTTRKSYGLMQAGIRTPRGNPIKKAVDYIKALRASAELWIWRNPETNFQASGHARNIFGNFFHTQMSFVDGMPTSLEQQGDYSIKNAGDHDEIQALFKAATIAQSNAIRARQQVAAITQQMADVEQQLGARDEQGVPTATTPEQEAVLARWLDIAINRKLWEQDVVSQELRAESARTRALDKTQNFRFAELLRQNVPRKAGGAKNRWNMIETMRALRQLGYTEVAFVNENVVAATEGWAAGALEMRQELLNDVSANTITLEQAEEAFVIDWVLKVPKLPHAVLARTNPDSVQEYNERADALRKLIGTHARKGFKTGNPKFLVLLRDNKREAEAMRDVFEKMPEHTAVLSEAISHLVQPKKVEGIMNQYRESLKWLKDNFETREVPLSDGFDGELYRKVIVRIPASFARPDAPLVMFRESLQPNTILPNATDAAMRNLNNDTNETTGDHC